MMLFDFPFLNVASFALIFQIFELVITFITDHRIAKRF